MDKPINILDKDTCNGSRNSVSVICLMQKDCQKEICAIQKSYISFIVKRLEFCSNLLPIQEVKLGSNIEHE